MKEQLISLGLLMLTALHSHAQTTVTVSVGAGYADQKWYSLENGEQATQAKDNWDLAFEITGYSSAILANTQKTGFALYKAPYNIAGYATLDTAGISSWPVLYNSDTTWTIGAFNRSADPANPYDLGWGVYDINTHFITGDSCYVVKLSSTSYKKLKLVVLANGTYNFEYANINGSASQTVALSKTSYTGKNFVYYDLSGNTAVDREPLASAWDLTFVKYTAFIPVAYPVVGVLSNKNVTVAQANDVQNVASYSNWAAHDLKTNISEIGSDWKTFDLSSNSWKLVNDTCYFVNDRSGGIWKLRFIAFGGSTDGNIVFTKEKISSVGIASLNSVVSQVAVYPNPSRGENTYVMITSEKALGDVTLSVVDVNGRLLLEETATIGAGLNTYPLTTAQLNSGVYLVRITAGSYTATQKLIQY